MTRDQRAAARSAARQRAWEQGLGLDDGEERAANNSTSSRRPPRQQPAPAAQLGVAGGVVRYLQRVSGPAVAVAVLDRQLTVPEALLGMAPPAATAAHERQRRQGGSE
jgi:hypothetical protein